jgi:trigger factor
MQVTETLSQGLKREYTVVLPAKDLEERLTNQLVELKDKVRINGFRPGKVPVQHLRRVYGRSVMADVLQNIVNETNRQIVTDHSLKLAQEPQILFPEAKEEVEAAMEAKGDLQYRIALEVLPEFEIADFGGLKLTREVAEVADAEIDEAINRMAAGQRPFAPKDGPAEQGDRVTIDFTGYMNGEPFEGGSGTDIAVEIGSNSFVPGFEEQLIGIKAGENRTLDITFPRNYASDKLAGQPASFEVTAKAVDAPGAIAIDDELAKGFGMESLEKLREAVKGQIAKDYGAVSRRKLKRALLDELDKQYDFELPPSLVDQEFQNIWRQVVADLTTSGKTFEDENTTEAESREEYGRIARRRVRLGLVLAEIGERGKVEVSEDELTQGVVERARQFPGQERMVWDYYRKNPQALAEIRAPLFEEKVIDHILATADITEKPVSKDELLKEDAEDEAKA